MTRPKHLHAEIDVVLAELDRLTGIEVERDELRHEVEALQMGLQVKVEEVAQLVVLNRLLLNRCRDVEPEQKPVERLEARP